MVTEKGCKPDPFCRLYISLLPQIRKFHCQVEAASEYTVSEYVIREG